MTSHLWTPWGRFPLARTSQSEARSHVLGGCVERASSVLSQSARLSAGVSDYRINVARDCEQHVQRNSAFGAESHE